MGLKKIKVSNQTDVEFSKSLAKKEDDQVVEWLGISSILPRHVIRSLHHIHRH